MKIQTSIEFLLILSAISILSLGLVSAYKSNMSSDQYALNSVMQNSNTISTFNSSSSGIVQDPGIFVNVPINSTIGMLNTMQVVLYGCINGTGSVRLSSGSVAFSQNDIEKIPLENLAVSSVVFDPTSAGPNQINVSYSITCTNAEKSGNNTFTTYSTVPHGSSFGTGNSSASLSAYISDRNESVSYPISLQGNAENIGQSSHCTSTGFWGNPYPVWIECGSSNAWDYRIESDVCYWDSYSLTKTYCILPQNSNRDLYGVNTSNYSYHYSFALSIASKYGELASNVANSANSELIDGGYQVGSVNIENVSGVADYQMPEFIGNSSDKVIANTELYQQYVQARNNMYSMLGYYNNTEVDPSTASSIQQAIASYETAASDLVASSGQGLQACSIVAGNYICRPSYLFSYVINAKTNLSLQNQTLYYEGSVINVTGS